MIFNLFLCFAVAIIHDTSAKNVLASIGEYADVAADIVSIMYQCEFSCPAGGFRFDVCEYKMKSFHSILLF